MKRLRLPSQDIPLKGMLQRTHRLHLPLNEVVRLLLYIRIWREFQDTRNLLLITHEMGELFLQKTLSF